MAANEKMLYVYSCDLAVPVQLKIGALEGQLPRPTREHMAADPSLQLCAAARPATATESPPSDLFVTCTVHGDGGRAAGVAARTSYRAFTTRCSWNEWLSLPVRFDELSRDALLALSVCDYHDSARPHVIASTTLPLFSKRSVFRRGIYDLQLWPFEEADIGQPSRTPGKRTSGQGDEADEQGERMRWLAKQAKKHRSGLVGKLDWLDRLSFREIELVNERHKRASRHLFLMVELPFIHLNQEEYLVTYFERGAFDTLDHRPFPAVVKYPDPEVGLENLIEAKHHVLTRSARSGLADRRLKPNASVRAQLDAVLAASPSEQLSNEQRDLVWKFRFFLSSDKKALTKFLHSVQWHQPHEARQAIELLNDWAPIDIDDALELLSPRFTHPAVRGYAVGRLREAPTQDLLLYLLQLVQALKYERRAVVEPALVPEFAAVSTVDAPLEHTESLEQGEAVDDDWTAEDADPLDRPPSSNEPPTDDLASFLIDSACKDTALANYFYWYLKVECDGSGGATDNQAMYLSVLRRLSRALVRGGADSQRRRAELSAQQAFVERIVQVMRAVAKESGNRRKKVELLQAQLSAPAAAGGVDLSRLDGLRLPLDPRVRVQSVVAERASLFNSALMPAKLTFRTTDNRDYVVIFKHGDDLRQDQLVIQMIRLMDRLLLAENLDLKLTPYNVLATGLQEGFVQFVDGQPLRDVVADWGTVQEFFRFYRPRETEPYGIERSVMENYVRSCAGYSVICYILGIGDRHQHNLLLCKNGRLFHVDFGYMLGRDPKPLPPPMKLTREMVDAMGGAASEQWAEFRRLCYTAFLHLRRHAALLVNLFSLMVDASIPDIALEPDKAVLKLHDRFHLHLSDEEAVQLVQHLIDASTSAKMAALADMVHDWAQILRK